MIGLAELAFKADSVAVTGDEPQAYVPLTFAPGEAYQFDWSHEIVVLNGATVTVKVAHMRLCHSRMPFVRAYPRETQENFFSSISFGPYWVSRFCASA